MGAKKYFGFEDWASIASEFSVDIGPEPELVYAVYSMPPYEGYAEIIFRRNGEWFLASGGHCSCYGLEGQWEPEPFDPLLHLKAIADGKRISRAYDTEGNFPEATAEAFDLWLHEAISA